MDSRGAHKNDHRQDSDARVQAEVHGQQPDRLHGHRRKLAKGEVHNAYHVEVQREADAEDCVGADQQRR